MGDSSREQQDRIAYLEGQIAQLTIQQQQNIVALNNQARQTIEIPHRLKAPPCFDGVRGGMVINDWTTSVESHEELYNWGSERTYLFATSYLSGRAFHWHRQLRKTEGRPTTWDVFKTLLIEKFRPDNSDLLAHDRLASLRQVSTIESYVESFTDICILLEDITEDKKCDGFMRGLFSDEVRAILRNIPRNKRTLDYYFSTALSYEAARLPQSQVLARHLATQSHVSSSPIEANDPMELDLIQNYRRQKSSGYANSGNSGNRIENVKQNQGNYSNNKNNNNMQCYFCRKKGHFKRDCFEFKMY